MPVTNLEIGLVNWAMEESSTMEKFNSMENILLYKWKAKDLRHIQDLQMEGQYCDPQLENT